VASRAFMRVFGFPTVPTHWDAGGAHAVVLHFRIHRASGQANKITPPSQFDDDFKVSTLASSSRTANSSTSTVADGNPLQNEGGTGRLNNQGPTDPIHHEGRSECPFLRTARRSSGGGITATWPNYYNNTRQHRLHPPLRYRRREETTSSTHQSRHQQVDALPWDLDSTWDG
jgi:hypothetical protein